LLTLGVENIKYFQLIANGKHRHTRIFQLQHEDTIIEGDQALKEYIPSYYKNMFDSSNPTSFSLDEGRVDGIEQVSKEENESLVRPFTVQEFGRLFFKWNIIKY
jgi:hypothetical protein